VHEVIQQQRNAKDLVAYKKGFIKKTLAHKKFKPYYLLNHEIDSRVPIKVKSNDLGLKKLSREFDSRQKI
jgi:hypothetical protein